METNSTANQRQVAGTHYRASYQHWDFVADTGMGYFEGQITKYVSRHRKKNGPQDLEKAQHFLEKLAELNKGSLHRPCRRVGGWLHRLGLYLRGGLCSVERRARDRTDHFVRTNGLSPLEAEVIRRVVEWETYADLLALFWYMDNLRNAYAEEGGATSAYTGQD